MHFKHNTYTTFCGMIKEACTPPSSKILTQDSPQGKLSNHALIKGCYDDAACPNTPKHVCDKSSRKCRSQAVRGLPSIDKISINTLKCDVSTIYRVSHNIGPTMFFVIFSGSGARTEELLTFIQQPWKFATL